MLTSKLEGNRIYNKFRELESKDQPALICYIVGGYPTLEHTEQIASALVKAGADIIEIGIPFSDPIADGPTIQRASSIALKNGVTPQKWKLEKKISGPAASNHDLLKYCF
jgi:tryptophan synthase alpha chain